MGLSVSARGTPSTRPGDALRARREPIALGVLNNPLSGGNVGWRELRRQARAELPGQRWSNVTNPVEVAEALRGLARAGADAILINGGDGTVQAVLTSLFRDALFETLPWLAVLGGGTTSMIAGDVGVSGRRQRGLARVLSWARGEGDLAVVRRPVLRVTARRGAAPVFGMFFGAAGILEGIEFCRRRVHARGLRGEIGAGIALVRLLLSLVGGRDGLLTPVRVTVEVDGGAAEEAARLAVLVTTLDRLLLGLRPYWGADQGPLHYTAIDGRPRHLLRVLPSLLRGRPSPLATPVDGYTSRNVTEVRLAFDGGFTVDGELFVAERPAGPVVLQSAGTVAFVR
jgi:diacylglycerol kinase (ATP)